ncbi:SDR family oxidoreductase [Pseudomonas sp. R2.Fl]|nr:SDR family oxidoreductase [Pseudomonas sp. R2.Fl]
MRVLVAGGDGLLGAALVRRLAAAGHTVILAGRAHDGAEGDGGMLALDYTAPPARATLVECLRGVDAVVNAVGIFKEKGKQSFDAVHVKGPLALFHAAVEAGATRIVQISALGADPGAGEEFLASKGRGDAQALALPVSVRVVRPSLVFAPEGASTRQFARWADLPLTPLPGEGLQRVQPIHIDDVAALLERLVVDDHAPAITAAVGPRPLELRAYLGAFRRAFARRNAFLSVPLPLLRRLLAWAGRAGAGLASNDALAMLERGNTADPSPLRALLGRPLRDPVTFFDRTATQALAMHVRRSRHLALMRWALAAMWLGTAWVSLFAYPRAASHALLARLGLHGSWAELALWSGALLDAMLGLALLVMRRRRGVYRAQLALVLAYTVLISAGLPEFWQHPFGPLLKNIPLLAMILALHALDRPDGSDPR